MKQPWDGRWGPGIKSSWCRALVLGRAITRIITPRHVYYLGNPKP